MGENSEAVARVGLAPTLELSEKRPATEKDFEAHISVSLACLERLAASPQPPVPGPHLLLLLSQHSILETKAGIPSSTPWSTDRHQALAIKLKERLGENVEEREEDDCEEEGIVTLLVSKDRRLFAQILVVLQPELSDLTSHPSAPHSLAWLVTRLPHPHLGRATPLLLPHTLKCLDSWLTPPRLMGCHIVTHMVQTSPPSELAWYGRAELLHSALTPLLSQDISSLLAVKGPLHQLTHLLHTAAPGPPSLPGPADTMLDRLAGLLELDTRGGERREVLAGMLGDTVALLGPGVVRWVPRIAAIVAASPSSPGILGILTSLCEVCPEAAARELPCLLPSLLRQAHSISWTSPTPDLSLLLAALTSVVETDSTQTKLLCHGLYTVTVNPTFDAIVQKLQLCD